MAALAVIPDREPLEEREPRRSTGGADPGIGKFGQQGGEEALGQGIVEARAGSAHRAGDAVGEEGLPSRVARAARLERRLYAAVRSDRTATAPAVTPVALLGLAHGLGGLMRGLAFGWNPVSGALCGLQGEIVFFVAASLGIYLVGRYALDATVT